MPQPLSPLPATLYRAAQVRELDRLAIEEQGIGGFNLMRRAGRAAFRQLLALLPEPEHLSIFCGTGNNGGDGYVMASLARQHGVPVTVVQCGDPDKIQGDALQARQLALQDAVPVIALEQADIPGAGVIVDAVLGTGLSGEVRGAAARAIELINASGAPVVAVDIPSGLCSDTGRVLGAAVRAQATVTFIGMKQGLLTGDGPGYAGAVQFADLGVPDAVYADVSPSAECLDLTQLQQLLPPRVATAHKGLFGHVLVAGGDYGMAGAAVMASQAAGRVGAGLTSCATRPEHVAALVARCPEVMAHGVVNGLGLDPLLERASVVVVGPGLGQQPWGEQLLQRASDSDRTLVVDADALNLLAARPGLVPRRDNWILTPHPGEAARLLACSTAEIAADRFAAVEALQQQFGGAVILKGAGTLVADASHPLPALCPYGNPGMASGGMGDVLSGILGGLLAQGLTVADAARLGVCLHAVAADRAARRGQRGLLATDLIAELRGLVNTDMELAADD